MGLLPITKEVKEMFTEIMNSHVKEESERSNDTGGECSKAGME